VARASLPPFGDEASPLLANHNFGIQVQIFSHPIKLESQSGRNRVFLTTQRESIKDKIMDSSIKAFSWFGSIEFAGRKPTLALCPIGHYARCRQLARLCQATWRHFALSHFWPETSATCSLPAKPDIRR
jgi:hypothetical protein